MLCGQPFDKPFGSESFDPELKTEGLAELLTKKPMIAEAGEIRGNPRSRSAKLRAIKIL